MYSFDKLLVEFGALAEKLGTALQKLPDGSITRTHLQIVLNYESRLATKIPAMAPIVDPNIDQTENPPAPNKTGT